MVNTEAERYSYGRTFKVSLTLIILTLYSPPPTNGVFVCNDTQIRLFGSTGEPPRVSCCRSYGDVCMWVGVNPTAIVNESLEESGRVIVFQSFGQFNCLNRNNSDFIEEKVIFIPEDNNDNCPLCMMLEACSADTEIRFKLIRFFDRALLHTQSQSCELYQDGQFFMFINTNTCHSIGLAENNSFDPTADHAVMCTICRNATNHITYRIPTHGFTDLDNCSVENSSILRTSTDVPIMTSLLPMNPTTSEDSTATLTGSVKVTTSSMTTLFPTSSTSSAEDFTAFPTNTSTVVSMTTLFPTNLTSESSSVITPTLSPVVQSNDKDNSGLSTGWIIVIIIIAIIIIIIVFGAVIVAVCYCKKLCCFKHKENSNSQQTNTSGLKMNPITSGSSNGRQPTSAAAGNGTSSPNTNNQREEETDYLPAQHVSQLLQCDDMELRELIQTHHPSLNKFINFTCLIPFFNQYKIFTNDEMYDFQSDKSDQEKTISLINYLQKKDANGVQNFIRSLHGAKEHSGHLVILKEMSSKLTV